MRKFLYIFFFIIICNEGFTQDNISKKSFTWYDSLGNIYVNRTEPFYLWLGFSPDSTKANHLLLSDSTRNYTNPFYFNNEGLNVIRSPWAVDTANHIRVYPLQEIEFEIYADGLAPVTRLIYGNVSPRLINDKTYFGKGLNIRLQAKDKTSGVYNTYFSLNGSPFQIYNTPINCSTEQEYNIEYYSVDNVQNSEKLKSYHFIVDNSHPETDLIIEGDQYENVVSQNTKIILHALDTISGVSKTIIRIDNGKNTRYKGPLNTSFLKQGNHTLYYYSIDRMGNKEIEKSFSFFVDNTPPILVEEVMGNSFMNNGKEYSSGRSKLKLTAVDNKAGVKAIFYSINSAEYEQYEKPFYLSNVSGSLNITSYAVDNVNNQSSASRNTTKRNVTYIDLTGPEIKIDFKGPVFRIMDSVYINNTTEIILQAKDDESGFKSMDFNIDDSVVSPYLSTFKIKKSGTHEIGATAFDNVNNSNHEDFKVIVDNNGPKIYSRFSILPLSTKTSDNGIVDVYSSQVALFLSVTDSKVAIGNIYYRINNETEKKYITYIGGFKQGVDYQIYVRATDKLGNESTETIHFATDNSGPEIFTQFSTPVKAQKEFDGENINVYPDYVSLFLSVTNAHVPYEKIYYSINNQPEKIYAGAIENFKPGSDIFMKIRAIDQLGNQTKKEIRFSIE